MRELSTTEVTAVNGGLIGAVIKGVKAIRSSRKARNASAAATVAPELTSSTPQPQPSGDGG